MKAFAGSLLVVLMAALVTGKLSPQATSGAAAEKSRAVWPPLVAHMRTMAISASSLAATGGPATRSPRRVGPLGRCRPRLCPAAPDQSGDARHDARRARLSLRL